MKKPIKLSILILLLMFFANKTFAAGDIYKNNISDLAKIESYLQNIKYLQSRFVQEAPDGSIAYGNFYLSRPGKMRVEYDAPANILIVVNGSVLAYQDIELEETSYLRTNSTPASFLTRKNISFAAKDIEIIDYKKSGNFAQISLLKKNKKEAGEFKLIFRLDPIQFIRMEVSDELEQITTVSLADHNFVDKIDNKLFIVKNNQLPQ